MSVVKYRTSFPLTEVGECISMVRSGEFKNNTPKFAFNAYQFLSWGLGSTIPYDPDKANVVPIGRALKKLKAPSAKQLSLLSDFEDALVTAKKDAPRAFGAKGGWFAMLLPLIQAMLKEFLSR